MGGALPISGGDKKIMGGGAGKKQPAMPRCLVSAPFGCLPGRVALLRPLREIIFSSRPGRGGFGWRGVRPPCAGNVGGFPRTPWQLFNRHPFADSISPFSFFPARGEFEGASFTCKETPACCVFSPLHRLCWVLKRRVLPPPLSK